LSQAGANRSGAPILRLAVALIFAIPAAIAGYALVHGITREAVPSETWRQIFCAIGGLVVGVSALTRLAGPATARAVRLLASIANCRNLFSD